MSRDQIDPRDTLREAEVAAAQGRHADALRAHVWFHEHALQHLPALAGVRLSFALAAWVDLGRVYPEALRTLQGICDTKIAALTAGCRSRDVFHDVAAIHRALGVSGRTHELFRRLCDLDGDFARACAGIALPAIVEARDFALATRFLPDPPGRVRAAIRQLNEDVRRLGDPGRGARHLDRKLAAQARAYAEEVGLILAVLDGADRVDAARSLRDFAIDWVEEPSVRAVVEDILGGRTAAEPLKNEVLAGLRQQRDRFPVGSRAAAPPGPARKPAMSDVDKVFSGSIPRIYQTHLVPLIFAPYADDLRQRVAALRVARVLEVAAGTGVVTRALAMLPDPAIAIVATDLNQAMLDEAAAVGTARPVQWRQADAMALPFGDGEFDAVVCQFGAMFFSDKPRAFAEARRVLRPGGMFLFNVWDRIAANEFADTVTTALAAVFPGDPPRFLARTPHGYHDRATIARDLAAGGFAGAPQFATVAARSRADSARVPAIAYCQGTPLRGEIEARDPAGLEQATAAAAAAIARRFGDRAVDGRIQAQVVTVVR